MSAGTKKHTGQTITGSRSYMWLDCLAFTMTIEAGLCVHVWGCFYDRAAGVKRSWCQWRSAAHMPQTHTPFLFFSVWHPPIRGGYNIHSRSWLTLAPHPPTTYFYLLVLNGAISQEVCIHHLNDAPSKNILLKEDHIFEQAAHSWPLFEGGLLKMLPRYHLVPASLTAGWLAVRPRSDWRQKTTLGNGYFPRK